MLWEPLTMKNLIFAGVAAGAFLFTAAPASASDSSIPAPSFDVAGDISLTADGAPKPRMGGKRMGGMRMGGKHMRGGKRMGGKHYRGGKHMRGGKRMGGKHFRGHRGKRHRGRNMTRRFGSRGFGFSGFILPSYWINPSYTVQNYSSYGLRAPSNGQYWSRYYNDAVLTDHRGYVYDRAPNVRWATAPAGYAPQGGHAQPDIGPAMRADREAYGWGEGSPDPRIDGETEAGTYEGQWTGRYVDPERRTYRGQWDGTYTNDQGQAYQGSYRGTSTGDPVFRRGAGAPPAHDTRYPIDPGFDGSQQPVAQGYPVRPAPASHHRRPHHGGGYAVPNGYGRYEKCLKSRGLAGGAIGAILGGFAGNRIAGRGDRLAGSLIGGGIGALAGVGIEKATHKCRKYLPRRQHHRPVANHHPHRYPQQQPYGYGWTPGYYYPQQQQAAVTTITIIPGTATTTTTTTEEVTYETVYTKARPRKGKHLRRPARTHKRCNC